MIDDAPEEKPDDVRGDVASALASLRTPDAPDTSLAAPEPAADDTPPPENVRQRDSRGQFIKADGSVDPDQTAKVSDADPAKVNDVQPSTAVAAPASWSAEAKAEFTKLPPAVQAAAVKREAEINEGGARWSEEKRALTEALAPVQSVSAQHKVPPGEVVKRLAAANDYLERDPGNAIRWLAKSYGVDLSKLATEQPTPQAQPDPAVASLSEKVSELQSYFQTQQQNETNGALASFADAKDAQGNPSHPHFNAVRVDMGKLMLAGLASDMQSAYEMAVWAKPDTRTSLLAAQTAGANAAQKVQDATAKAKRAALSVNGSPNGAVPPPRRDNAGASVEDDVRAAMEQLRH